MYNDDMEEITVHQSAAHTIRCPNCQHRTPTDCVRCGACGHRLFEIRVLIPLSVMLTLAFGILGLVISG